MLDKTIATPAAPAVARLPKVDWDLISPLIRCPACESHVLNLKSDALVCSVCMKSYAIENGIIDFVGARTSDAIPFYANPYYRRFMEGLLKIHEAHYAAGGFSVRLEKAIKLDLFKLVEKSDAPNVDLGCGLGECFPLMGEEDRIIGVDYEMELLKKTRERYPKATLLRGDFAELPFRTASLERVFSIAVLEHVFFLESAMKHMQRCLSPSGRFYVSVPTEGGLAVETARIVTSTRNAKLIQLTPSQSRMAQRKDHCNTVFLIENMLRKFFDIDATLAWPFRLGGKTLNLSQSYRLKAIVPQ